MITKEEAVEFCLSIDRENTYKDAPFHDGNWILVRHKSNKKMFASVYTHMGNIWINVKCKPDMTFMWRSAFDSVIPAYHMNKIHWNSIILDGSIPEEEVKNMVWDSYELTKGR